MTYLQCVCAVFLLEFSWPCLVCPLRTSSVAPNLQLFDDAQEIVLSYIEGTDVASINFGCLRPS